MEYKKIIDVPLWAVVLFIIVFIGGLIGLQSVFSDSKIETAQVIEQVQEKEKITEVAKAEDIENQEERNSDIMVTSRSSISRATRQEDIVDKLNVKYKSLNEIKISKNMNLTERTGVSKADFKALLTRTRQDTSGFFERNAEFIYDLCEEYSINEIFFCGLISAESGWNIASNHRRTHNYVSMMSKGQLIQYNSDEEGLTAAAKMLHNKYLTPGGSFYYGPTLEGVHTKYCPSDTWVGLVYARMQQLMSNI